jgi:hypothetical protein
MSPESKAGMGKRAAVNFGKAELDRVKDRIDESTEGFKFEAAQKIESLAEQIRHLGEDSKAHAEAGSIARRLERTADYLRYRPTSDIAEDALDTVRESKAFWIAAGLLVGILIYRSVRAHSGVEVPTD